MEQEKVWTWRMLAAFLGVLTIFSVVGIFVSLGAYGVFRGSAPASHTITVQGQGEVIAVPDIAQIVITVTEEGKTADESQSKVTVKINKILAYLEEQKIAEKDIKTTGYYTNPKYETQYGSGGIPAPVPLMMRDSAVGYGYVESAPSTVIYPNPYPCTDYDCPPTKNVIVGYETSHTLEIKIRDTDEAGEILAGISKIGVTYSSGVNLTHDDYTKLQQEARTKAIQDARKQAEDLVRELGAKLGRVVSYSDYGYPIY